MQLKVGTIIEIELFVFLGRCLIYQQIAEFDQKDNFMPCWRNLKLVKLTTNTLYNKDEFITRHEETLQLVDWPGNEWNDSNKWEKENEKIISLEGSSM